MGHAIVSGGARASVPVTGIKLGNIAEGQTIKLLENGTTVEFYVVKHNYESSLNGPGRTLLWRKDIYSLGVWEVDNVNSYQNSDVRVWLNGSYKNLFDQDTQSAMWSTKFRSVIGNGNWNLTTLNDSVFLLSATEIGFSESDMVTEGTALQSNMWIYMPGGPIPSFDNCPYYWTRSPYTGNSVYTWYIRQYSKTGSTWSSNGQAFNNSTSNNYGIRPAFTLPSGALFDEETLTFIGKVA